jgi:parallel beta-helix repeat protein
MSNSSRRRHRGNVLVAPAVRAIEALERRTLLSLMAGPTSPLPASTAIIPSPVSVTPDIPTEPTVWTVTNTSDTTAPGSLRAAITNANADSADINLITFDIPTTDPGYSAGIFTITLASNLPAITQLTILEGNSQLGYAGQPVVNIEPNNLGLNGLEFDSGSAGSSVEGMAISDAGVAIGIYTSSVTVTGCYLYHGSYGVYLSQSLAQGTSSNCTIGGTSASAANVINGFDFAGIDDDGGGDNLIEGNDIGVNPENPSLAGNEVGISLQASHDTIGGTAPGAGNVISGGSQDGISINGANQTTVAGNFIGTNAAGTAASANGGVGVQVESNDNVIGPGNVISGNGADGIDLFDSTSNTVVGNYIGLNAAGTAAIPNGDAGIALGSPATSTAGITVGPGNVISGNAGDGIDLVNAANCDIAGNLIGTNAAGTAAFANGGWGVNISGGAAYNQIGGTVTSAGNVIAFNALGGVGLAGSTGVGGAAGDFNAIRTNSIYGNGGLGIDINEDGVSANSTGPQTGPNNMQNFPVLSSATANPTSTTVAGQMTWSDDTSLYIDFYSNPLLGPGGSVQGKTYLGSIEVTTNGSGTASFTDTLPAVQVGQYIIATATTTVTVPYGDTSEFSPPVQVMAPVVIPPPPPTPTGSLVGSQAIAASSYNLTALGTTDWIHWGQGGVFGSIERKATGGSQISNVTEINPGGGNFGGYTDSSRSVSWTDGSPTASDSGDHGYIWANNAIGAGYSFTVPAGTATQTLYVYAGGYYSGGTLTAHLSGGSAANYVASASASGNYIQLYTITFQAASAGQTLTITYVKTENINGYNGGSVDLIAAALDPPAGPDTTVPTAALTSAPTITAKGSTAFSFNVTYSDNVAVKAATLGNANILVTGPGGYSQLATLTSTGLSNGSSIVATYSVPAPAGGWSSAVNGKYTITLEGSQVSDTSGNFAAAGTLGTFNVNIAASIVKNPRTGRS